MKNKFIFLALIFSGIFQQNNLSAQFTFGVKSGLVLSQVEGDNMVGFKKVGYDVGVLGGYAITEDHNLLIELSLSRLGSRKGSDPVPDNITKSLWELDMNTINIFTAYTFRFGDNWDGVKDFKFTGGLKFNKIYSSDLQIYNKRGLTSEEKTIDSNYISIKAGPGVLLTEHLALDFYYEHALANIVKNNNETQSRSLNPFTLNFILSYYF